MITKEDIDTLRKNGFLKLNDRFLWNVSLKEGDRIFPTPVFSREEEHEHGKRNNTSPNYWLLHDKLATKYYDAIESDDKTELAMVMAMPLAERLRWIPYGDKYAQPVNCWSYNFEAYNKLDHYTKWDSDEWSVKSGMKCDMFCNGIHVWQFYWGGSDMSLMMSKAQVLANELTQHHGFEANNPDAIIGKKVWYHDQEAEIVRHFFPEDRIVVKSCRPDGKGIDLKSHKKNEEGNRDDGWPESDWHGSMEVHTGLFDSGISWFRK